MAVCTIDDKASDTLVVVPGDGFWTGSSTLPHLHQYAMRPPWSFRPWRARIGGRPTILDRYGVGEGLGLGEALGAWPTRMSPITLA